MKGELIFMFGFSSFEIGLLLLLGSFCVFSILNRICSCIEHCSTARAVGKMNAQGLNIRQEDVENFIDERTKKNS